MQAHKANRSAQQEIMQLRVHAARIFDLRNAAALTAAGIDLADAVAPWQEIVAAGGTPSSWRVRQQLETLGAAGLIDLRAKRRVSGIWCCLAGIAAPGSPRWRSWREACEDNRLFINVKKSMRERAF